MPRRRLVLLALAITPPLAAQPPGRALTIEDFYRLKTVGAPELSPDGRWVAYTLGTRVEATNGTTSEVWLVATDGSAPARRVSAGGTDATAPRWDDDGRLRFTVGGRPRLVRPAAPDTIAEPDRPDSSAAPGGQGGSGDNATRLVSPDGRWVAVVRDLAPPKRERAFASEFERRHEERFRGVQFDWLDFQRDGQPFPVPNRVDPAVSPPREIFLSPNGGPGGAPRQLTALGLRPAGLTWRPDGSALLFTADSAYRDERKYGSDQVYAVSAGGAVRRLTPDGDVDHSNARYSPDGRWVLYTRQLSTDAVIARKMRHGAPVDLAVIPADGGPERNLTADWDYLPANARWSPDGRHVYFTGGVGGTTHLFRVPAGGGLVEQVTTGERRVANVSFDRGFTRIAFTVGQTEAPPEVHVADVDGRNERRLTRAHDTFAAGLALGKAERLRFRSRDGTPLEGWLLLPYGYQPNGGLYPLVVSSHGGPHAADGYAFDFKNQLLAANGYAVLQVNFRSSTGYGEKFLWGTWGAWGTKDGEDVMAGVDHALARYRLDRRRVATIGHSYGGFMTNWLITQYPDRFAAAIPGAGIVNWVSDYGTADVARTKETEFFGTPWEARAREIMIRQSPLTYAHRVKAATLFVHGELDQRVPYSEAEQMYVALKKNGVPTKMIQYAGQAHSISGHWNQVHRMLNELRWLDRYLKGDAKM